MLDGADLGHEAHAGLEAEPAGGVAVAVEEQAGPHHVEGHLRIGQRRAGVGAVAKAEADAARTQGLDHAAENAELLPGVGLVVLARLVGDREVREDPLGLEPGQGAGARHVLHAAVEALAPAEEAQARHAGVEGDVDAQRAAEPKGLGGKLLRLFEVRDRLRDVVFQEHARVLKGRVAEDQDRHRDAAVAQLHRLVETGHGEIICPRLLQSPRHLKGAVAVGVGLDHAEEAAALRQGRPDGADVVPDVLQADLRPGPLFQLAHSFTCFAITFNLS